MLDLNQNTHSLLRNY